MIQLLDDKREISTIWFSGYSWTTNANPYSTEKKAEKIEVYAEPGLYCNMPWFAIWKEGSIISRIPASSCDEVLYKEVKDAKNNKES